MIEFKTTETLLELKQILALQAKNTPINLTEIDKKEQGFVTVQHDLAMLRNMHELHSHSIATHNDNVIGYALSMSKKFRGEIPVLTPMFTEIDISIKSNSNYIIMGQVCIDKNYRGKGIFRGLYTKMKDTFKSKHDCIITKIDTLNTRSIKAHKAIGFKELVRYNFNNQTWVVVYMDI
ncbi:N-acetyltransferase [Tenacibaculum sp. Bg11-29]|uniref:GNAT family N-acetyltransferase n=1 Tax=Tenacibaculum sp. Bg11-29 TaxID=2058306 RepID=UPI000C34DEA7|nr:GNAT family N-acetyltransferase [Tenacibaculum sp. Bg11-29]PKH49753.1 N-acetyltransferase [Tenacibaculum sp. Bg11-29]